MKIVRHATALAATLCSTLVFTAPASGQDAAANVGQAATMAATLPYLDDRSTPQVLLLSLYNAINRGEYSRAYAYFRTPPAKDLDSYAAGFSDTAAVQVVLGALNTEGAAGSRHAIVPIALRATDKDGGERCFSGCMTLRTANPQVPNDAFNGWTVETSNIRPAEEMAVPECDGEAQMSGSTPFGPLPALDAAYVPQAIAMTQAFAVRASGECDLDWVGLTPASFDVVPPADTDGEPTLLGSFVCNRGAYNVTTRWFSATDPQTVADQIFAEPVYDHTTGPKTDGNEEGPLESLTVTGWKAVGELFNADFDVSARTISTYAKARGLGDAFTTATYVFDDEGDFRLRRFEADPTLDGRQDAALVYDADARPE